MVLETDRFQPEAVLASTAPQSHALPRRLLYATSAGMGGTGLDSTSLEGALASDHAGILRRAIAFGIGTREIPGRRLRSLNWHPVRLLSWLKSEEYYAAKKRYVDAVAALHVRIGNCDAFHGWSGDCFHSLVEARLKGVPTVIDIPTWHRNKGVVKPGETRSEREARLANRGWRDWRQNLLIDRTRMLAEYDLADVILVPSRKAAETFLAAGIPESKLHYVARGVDPSR
ncbi:MAG: glycosyltransferase family 1 protein, partial [Verrucomicrobiaceae bacterium]|nr:glycosyltransferase family 1 protein [Verrucomicrobiaceae bacterium]